MNSASKIGVALATTLFVWLTFSAFIKASADQPTDQAQQTGTIPAPTASELQPYIQSLVNQGRLSSDSLVYVVPGCNTCTILPNPAECPKGQSCYVLLGDYPMFKITLKKTKYLVDANKQMLPKSAYQGFEFAIRVRKGTVSKVIRKGFTNFAVLESQTK